MSTSKKVGTRRKGTERVAYHHGNLRLALVQTGLQSLESAERGELSLREMARKVGVSPNAVYRHFADKESFLAALAAEGFRQLKAAQLAAAERARDPAAVLLAAADNYVAFARARPGLYRLMFGRFGSSGHGEELDEASQASFSVLLSQVAAARRLEADDPQVLPAAIFAWGLTHGLSQLSLDGQFKHLDGDPSALVDAALRVAGIASTDPTPVPRRSMKNGAKGLAR